MPWRRYNNSFTERQKEFLEKFFALAKQYEKDGVFASGMESDDNHPQTYRAIVLVWLLSESDRESDLQ